MRKELRAQLRRHKAKPSANRSKSKRMAALKAAYEFYLKWQASTWVDDERNSVTKT